MADYRDAILRPFRDLKTMLLGGLINAIPIVNLAGIGYALQCATHHSNSPPKWDALPRLWLDGLLVTLGSLIYMLPGIILVLIGVISVTFDLTPGQTPALAAWQLAFIILGILWFLFAQYILPAAQVHYAIDGRLRSMFEFSEVIKQALTFNYLKTWLFVLLWSVVLSIAGFILSILTFITLIGPLYVNGLITYTILVTAFTLFGETYLEGN